MVLGGILVSFFYKWLTSFLKVLIKVFDPLLQKLETTQVPFTKGMEKYTVIYIHYKHTINNEKELTMQNSQLHTATKSIFTFCSVGKTNTEHKEYVLHNSTYMTGKRNQC